MDAENTIDDKTPTVLRGVMDNSEWSKDDLLIDEGEVCKRVKSILTNAKKIDAKKLKTLEDVILVIECLGMLVQPWSENYKKLEHLLEDEQC